jgi:hypothetical protein
MKCKCDKCGCFMKAVIVKSSKKDIEENDDPKEFLGWFECKKCKNKVSACNADIIY